MSFIATAVSTKVAIAALSLIAIGGGSAVAVAATNGSFPSGSPSQIATSTAAETATDDVTDAPPTADSTPSSSPTNGPDATGQAAFGLCTAFTAGGLNSGSVAYAALLSASSSAGSITDYCAPILAAKGATNHKPTSVPTPTTDHRQSGDDHGKSTPVTHGH